MELKSELLLYDGTHIKAQNMAKTATNVRIET